MKSKRCTCAPHPSIDLTDAYFEYHGRAALNDIGGKSSACSDGIIFDDVRKQIQNACQSHGCFHVSIRHPTSSAENSPCLPIGCLAKSREDIERGIEALFSPPFLNESLPNVSSLEWEEICDNGTVETVFCDDSINLNRGTFRGRSAESGDEGHPKPEPKLSWEYQRCCSPKQPVTSPEIIKTSLANQQWRVLPQWTEALHSVAVTVIHLLGIPPMLVLRERPCNCSRSSTSESPSYKHPKCNIDLLRVFRYDTIDINDSSLGSSAHSDWGTVTVVWQDDKGGLQTYCDSCEKWSNVDAAASIVPDNYPSNDESSVAVNLFLHVGDFLSLASIQDNVAMPIWHSPRHRVLCPVRSCEESLLSTFENSNLSSKCRRSLVYFAYPPPGISLNDAQSVIRHITSTPASDTTRGSSRYHTMKMYSVLHDQSHETIAVGVKQFNRDEIENVEEATAISYERIRGTPFDEIIERKWGQVQRK